MKAFFCSVLPIEYNTGSISTKRGTPPSISFIAFREHASSANVDVTLSAGFYARFHKRIELAPQGQPFQKIAASVAWLL